MKALLKHHYGGLWRAPGLVYEIQRSAAAFLTLTVLSFGLCMALPAVREQLAAHVVSMLGNLPVTDGNGSLSPVGLFLNNLRACLFTMFYGCLPFLYLPALALGINSIMIGGLAAWYLCQGHSLLGYLAAILPHGIFELPALVLAMAMGLLVCGQISRRCRLDASALPLWSCLVLIARMLFLVLTPLLAAAALTEAYITPIFAAWFF